MKHVLKHRFQILLLCAVLSVRFFWQASFLTKPIDTLLGLVTDDLFYYLAISHNIFTGKGVSFDGFAPTNGFHPLFMALVYPLNLISDLELRAKAALLMLMVLDFAACLLLFRALRTFVRPIFAWAGVLTLAISKDHALISLHGLETPLATCLLAVVFDRACRLKEREQHGAASAALLGVLVGLTSLARTDLGLMALGLPLVLLWEKMWTKPYAAFWLAWMAVLCPWVAWNMAVFHTPLQSSAHTHAYREWAMMKELLKPSGGSLAWAQIRAVAEGLRYPVESFGGKPFWVFILAIPAAFFSVLRRRRAWQTPGARVAFFCTAVITAMSGAYSFFFHFQHWYLHSLYWCLVLSVTLCLDFLAGEWPRSRAFLIGGAMVAGVGVHNLSLGTMYYPMMKVNPPTLKFVRETFPSSTRIGMFSSGYYKYFLPDHSIINLDGAVNNEILKVLRGKSFYAYLREKRIEYVIDYEVSCRNLFTLFGPGPLEAHFEPWAILRHTVREWNILVLKVKE